MIYFIQLFFLSYKSAFYRLTYIFILAVLFACSTQKIEPDPKRLGYHFFPLEKGNFLVYDVEEITYSLTSDPVIITYQVKEVVRDTFIDLTKEKAYLINRFSRADKLTDWILDSVWTAKQTDNYAIRTENNISFLKLVFPVTKISAWNGNALNNLSAEPYRIEALNQPFRVLQNDFEHTLHVIQGGDTSANLIDQLKQIEVYAKDVGLIYKERVKLQFCSASETCLGKGQIDFGTKFYQKLSSHGKE